MTFSRVNVGGWALYEILTSAQMNQLDLNVSRSLDGYAGGDYSPSSVLRVHGKIIGEDETSRAFRYPNSLGLPDAVGDWIFDFTNYRWTSDTSASQKIVFPLNRFLQNGLQLRRVLAWVDQIGANSGTNRMSLEIVQVGTSVQSIDKSYYDTNGGSGQDFIRVVDGFHDGGDGQSSLTDSLKNWQTDWLVGGEIFNTTDGSSGTITANTATGITATLSGGTDNDWDDDDEYYINMVFALNTAAYNYYAIVTSANDANADVLHYLQLTFVETDYLIPA